MLLLLVVALHVVVYLLCLAFVPILFVIFQQQQAVHTMDVDIYETIYVLAK
jgi:hypothetical protein